MQQEIFEEHEVGGLRINVVGAEQVELLLALREQVIHRGSGLLVHGFGGVENVLGHFFALVLHGVEEQAVVLLEDRQHGLAAHRSPAAEGHGDLVFLEQLLGFFGEERPVRGAVDDDGLDLLAQHAALGVDFVEGEKQDVAQRGFADGHRAGESGGRRL